MLYSQQIKDFLIKNPEFDFHVLEFIESTKFIKLNKKQFYKFCRDFENIEHCQNGWSRHFREFRTIASNVRAYKNIEWKSCNYLDSINIIDKELIRQNEKSFLNSSYKKKELWKRPCSGTSGPPIITWYSPDFFFDFQFFLSLKVAWIIGEDTTELLKRPVFSIVLGDQQYLNERVWSTPDRSRGLTLRVLINDKNNKSTTRALELIGYHKPGVLSLSPGILSRIITHFPNPDNRIFNGVKFIISGGSELSEDLRKKGERILGVPIYNSYGLSELGLIACECSHKEGMHIFENEIIAEVLKKNGEISSEGKGELIISKVANKAMPLIRYRTNDIVNIITEPCRCGRLGRRIKQISGRVVKNFILSDGTEYGPMNLKLFSNFYIREFRISQVKLKEIHAEIEFFPSTKNKDKELNRIKDFIRKELNSKMKIVMSQKKFDPFGKFQRYRRFF